MAAAAGTLLAQLEGWMWAVRCLRSSSQRQLDECLAALYVYLDRFSEWRARDAVQPVFPNAACPSYWAPDY